MKQPATTETKLFIGGGWKRGRGAEIASHFPADGSLNSNIPGAGPEDVDLAIERKQDCRMNEDVSLPLSAPRAGAPKF